MNIKIRKASASDIPFLMDIARTTIRTSYRNFIGKERIDDYINSGASDQYILENISECEVLLLSEGIVGFCVCKGDLIDLMMIVDGFHRQGLGSQLLKYCEYKLFKNHSNIRLESFEGNGKANNFYKKNAWTEAGLRFDEVSGAHKIMFVKEKQKKL